MNGSAEAEVTAQYTVRKKGSAIGAWHTNYRGITYTLTDTGRLQKEEQMSNTHIQNMETDRHRDATRAVHDELLQLAARRAEQHAKEQSR